MQLPNRNDSDSFPLMAEYVLKYKGEECKVQVVNTGTAGAHISFLVFLRNDSFLLNKTRLTGGDIIWIGKSGLSEDQQFGEWIESQIGYELPLPETNNPFEYTGEVHIEISEFVVNGIKVEKAKAPYSKDIYYRVSAAEWSEPIIICKFFFMDEPSWHGVFPERLRDSLVENAARLIEAYEAKFQCDNK